MKQERELNRDLSRLAAAIAMLTAQQWEQTWSGDEEEREDVIRETHDLVSDVLKRIEQALDEDLVEQLDRMRGPGFFNPFAITPLPFRMPFTFPFAPMAGNFSCVRKRPGNLEGTL